MSTAGSAGGSAAQTAVPSPLWRPVPWGRARGRSKPYLRRGFTDSSLIQYPDRLEKGGGYVPCFVIETKYPPVAVRHALETLQIRRLVFVGVVADILNALYSVYDFRCCNGRRACSYRARRGRRLLRLHWAGIMSTMLSKWTIRELSEVRETLYR